MAVIGKWSMPLHSDNHYGQIPVAGDDTTEKTKALGWRISVFVNLNFQNIYIYIYINVKAIAYVSSNSLTVER